MKKMKRYQRWDTVKNMPRWKPHTAILGFNCAKNAFPWWAHCLCLPFHWNIQRLIGHLKQWLVIHHLLLDRAGLLGLWFKYLLIFLRLHNNIVVVILCLRQEPGYQCKHRLPALIIGTSIFWLWLKSPVSAPAAYNRAILSLDFTTLIAALVWFFTILLSCNNKMLLLQFLCKMQQCQYGSCSQFPKDVSFWTGTTFGSNLLQRIDTRFHRYSTY